MTNVMTRLARELADAISVAIKEDPSVAACWEKARAAGYEMQVSLEAVVGFGSRARSQAPAELDASDGPEDPGDPGRPIEMTADDRRFLRSLRIAADEIGQQVE